MSYYEFKTNCDFWTWLKIVTLNSNKRRLASLLNLKNPKSSVNSLKFPNSTLDSDELIKRLELQTGSYNPN